MFERAWLYNLVPSLPSDLDVSGAVSVLLSRGRGLLAEQGEAEPYPGYGYYHALIGLFRAGGFSLDLTHHALHALGTRAFGYTHEPWDDSQPLPDSALLARQMVGDYPNIAAMLETVDHDADTSLGWCDDQFEFEFALDVLLGGLERRHDSKPSRPTTR